MLHHDGIDQIENAQAYMDKVALRATILAQRSDLDAATLADAAETISQHVNAFVRRAGATRVCAYLPVGSEPGSAGMLDELREAGVEVLLPVLRADDDLDWARHAGPAALAGASRGLREPTGSLLGVGAIAGADLVIVPALAVDGFGNRLGRGGGSYDRALARVAGPVPMLALLHDGEVLPAVPHAAHDVAVTHAVTPKGGAAPLSRT